MNSKIVIGTVVGLTVGLVLGVFIGVLFISPSGILQPTTVGYTRVKVLSDNSATLKLGELPNQNTYVFYYKSTGHYDMKGIWIDGYSPQTPIAVDVYGNSEANLAPTVGKVYDVLGIEINVSEVHNDYVILLVKYL